MNIEYTKLYTNDHNMIYKMLFIAERIIIFIRWICVRNSYIQKTEKRVNSDYRQSLFNLDVLLLFTSFPVTYHTPYTISSYDEM